MPTVFMWIVAAAIDIVYYNSAILIGLNSLEYFYTDYWRLNDYEPLLFDSIRPFLFSVSF